MLRGPDQHGNHPGCVGVLYIDVFDHFRKIHRSDSPIFHFFSHFVKITFWPAESPSRTADPAPSLLCAAGDSLGQTVIAPKAHLEESATDEEAGGAL